MSAAVKMVGPVKMTMTIGGQPVDLKVKSDFQVGWDIYAAGGADSDCATPEQVRGWWMALDADVTADMCDVVAADGLDSDDMDEVFDGLHLAYCQ